MTYCLKRDINYLIVSIPNKEGIYSNYLPDNFARLERGNSALDILKKKLKDQALPFLDLTDILYEKSKLEPIYFSSDAHWNTVGAYYAYIEIMNNIGMLRNENMKSVSLESYNITKKVRKGDLARMLDMELEFIEFNYPYIVSTTSKLETPVFSIATP